MVATSMLVTDIIRDVWSEWSSYRWTALYQQVTESDQDL